MIDDSTLLQRYAAQRDEAAFAEVVRRHLPFVYAAAVRRLGRATQHADDVTQRVFCALAREAGPVSRQPVLSGWLYTATRNAVLNVIRGEKRRRAREEEAAYMRQIDCAPEPATEWSTLRPVLDASLDRLSARDREAVLLRFFAGRSFSEIGALLDLSEDAARKRVERALAKLRDRLRPQGVAATPGGLAALLASQPASAAPAGLLATVTGAALTAGGAVAAFTSFIAMTKLQTAMVAGVLAAAGLSLVLQQRTISGLRDDLAHAQGGSARVSDGIAPAAKRANSAGSPATMTAGTASGEAGASSAATAVRGGMLAATTAALQNGKLPEGYFAFASVLQRLTRENWREVLRGFEEERRRTGLGHPRLVEVFVRRAGEVAGREAVDHFLASGWGGEENQARIGWVSNEAMIGWASQHPAEALQWLGRDASPETRRRLMGAAIRGLALTEPDLAVKTLEAQPAKERDAHTTELITSALRSVGLDGARQLVEGMIARAAENDRLKERYLRNVVHDYSSMSIYQATASGNIADAVTWLNRHVGQPYFDHGVITEVTRRFALENPQEAFRWLEGVNATLLRAGESGTAGYRMLFESWQAKAGVQPVESWLQGQASHPHYDQLAWQYAALVGKQDAARAQRWADTIKDPRIKQQVLQLIGRQAPKSTS